MKRKLQQRLVQSEKNETDTSFGKKYGCLLLLIMAILLIVYILVYFCFAGNGIFPTGVELKKSDWLAFLGSYLSFGGTVFVSFIAVFQNKQMTERANVIANVEKEKAKTERETKRLNEIQPIFSIQIQGTDRMLPGVAEVFSVSDSSSLKKHQNAQITIENVGSYPIRNVIIFEKYICQLLKPHSETKLIVAYPGSPDLSYPDRVIEVLESDHGRSEEGIPKDMGIVYDDIDGNAMHQIFALKAFEGVKYYSLVRTETIETAESNK